MNLDEIIADSRERIDRLRKQFPDPEDFDHHIVKAVERSLEGYDYHPQQIALVMGAIFGEKYAKPKHRYH